MQNSPERVVGLLTTTELQLLLDRLEPEIGLLNGVIQRGNTCYAHDAFSWIGHIRTAASRIDGVTAITSVVMIRRARMPASIQCDSRVGIVIVLSISWVTPPKMPSRRRECPYAPITSMSRLSSAARDRMDG